MRAKRWFLIASALGMSLIGTGVAGSADESAAAPPSATVTLAFSAPDGGSFSDAAVRVYLKPFNHPDVYVPSLIAQGRTNSDGRFTFVPTDSAEVIAQALVGAGVYPDTTSLEDLSAEELERFPLGVNLIAKGVDRTLRWGASLDLTVPLFEALEVDVPATTDLSFLPSGEMTEDDINEIDFVQCDPIPDPDSGDPFAETEPDPDWEDPGPKPANEDYPACLVPKPEDNTRADSDAPKPINRPVKIFVQSVSTGVNGRVCYRNGTETQTETAVQVGYDGDWGAWKVGGWSYEHSSRGNGTCSPSESADGNGKPGKFHRVRYAEYQFRAWKHTHCNYFGTTCYQERHFEPYGWTGGRGFIGPEVTKPDRDSDLDMRLPDGDDWWKDRKNQARFGAGLSFAGLTLGSQSGYSHATSIWWLSTGRCRKNFLYTGGQLVPKADWRFIYSDSVDC